MSKAEQERLFHLIRRAAELIGAKNLMRCCFCGHEWQTHAITVDDLLCDKCQKGGAK
jgi:hypothetical protein